MDLTEDQKKDFMKKAAFIADQSSCGYKIGCVGVVKDTGQNISPLANKDPQFRRKDGFIYLKTWNETLKGEIFCQNGSCIRVEESLKGKDFQKVCSIHAEVNLISKCAKYQISTNGMALFITNSPCYICAKSIIQTGIKEVYYLAEHTDMYGIQILKENNIQTDLLRDIF